MSLMTNVQRDVNEYEEKIFFGLTARKLACWAAVAIVVLAEVGIGYFVLGIGMDNVVLVALVILTAMCGFAYGYMHPMGMKVEEAIPLYLKQAFGKTEIRYESSARIARRKTEEAKKKAEGGKDAGKTDAKRQKEYRRIKKYRGARSPEYLIPRYFGQL